MTAPAKFLLPRLLLQDYAPDNGSLHTVFIVFPENPILPMLQLIQKGEGS